MDSSTRDPAAPEQLPGALRQLARNAWQAVLFVGIASIALGVIVLAWPHATLAVLGVLFGIYLLLSGIVQLAAAFGTHAQTSLRVLGFISGALCILLGLFCFRGTLESILLLTLWIGIGWLFRGIAHTMAAASDPMMPERGWQIFAGIVTVLAGVVVITAPATSISVLTAFAGIWLLVMGVLETVTAWRLRKHAKSLPSSYY